MSAIEATTAGFKDMADGTVRFFFDVEPRHADDALRLFRERGRAAALAALLHAHEGTQEWPQIEPEKPKGGERSKWVAMRCGDEKFHRWLSQQYPMFWDSRDGSDAVAAAEVVRRIVEVQSRAEIDTNEVARARFDALIRKPYMESQK